uniref:Putative secreted protein n=1 Tax=Anopheles triannulatus TaxID=58253 RepID=A0A2M4B6N7_9DIPT
MDWISLVRPRPRPSLLLALASGRGHGAPSTHEAVNPHAKEAPSSHGQTEVNQRERSGGFGTRALATTRAN